MDIKELVKTLKKQLDVTFREGVILGYECGASGKVPLSKLLESVAKIDYPEVEPSLAELDPDYAY